MRIAIIGTGIAGNAAAYALSHASPAPRLIVYERNALPGGHSATAEIDYDGQPMRVDTGFIVYNEPNYPQLTAMFRHLGVATEPSDMSFAFSAQDGRFEWSGNEKSVFASFFAQRRNLASPAHWRLLSEIWRFQRIARADLLAGAVGAGSLGAWLDRHGFSARMRDRYILPMGAAIWSMPQASMLDFPAATLIGFFDNHGLLTWQGHPWRTVSGGSCEYVDRLTAPFRRHIRTGVAVVSLKRDDLGVTVTDARGHTDRFDHVILASHAPQSLALLSDATRQEHEILGAVKTAPNAVFLHRDKRLMPRRRAAWASWNVLRAQGADGSKISVTYWMNRLQNLDAARPLFVSLNPPREPDPALTFARYTYDHPQFNAPALAAQQRLESIQGRRRTWFCGAWTRYGFHEDGLRSGLDVAASLGAAAPWSDSEALALKAAE